MFDTSYLVTGSEVAVSGPDGAVDHVRIARLAAIEQRIRIHRGDDLIVTADLTAADPMAEPVRIGYSLPEVLDRVQVGDRVYFDDGEFGGRVIAKTTGELRVQIDQIDDAGAWLRAEKGINLPDSDLGLSGLTEDDRAVLPFIVEHADGVEMSFVDTADDLAVEAGFARMGELQEEIMWLCEAAHVPVIWATQVLENLAKSGRPSRAEVTDAALSVRSEGVMLNKGPFILDAVSFLDHLLTRMSDHLDKKSPLLRRLRLGGGSD